MSNENENLFESEIVNGVAVASQIDASEVRESLEGELGRKLELYPGVSRALATWAEDSRSDRRTRGLFQTDKYVTPGKVFDQMRVAYDALDDDVVGNIADVSEAMAFQRVTFETADDKDQENIWHQIGRDLDLDAFVRTMWRELYVTSACYPVRWWGKKNYKVKTKKDKRMSRKEYDLIVPTQLGFLDPLKVVPVNPDPFGEAQLAYILDSEDELDGEDEFIKMLFLGQYTPSQAEAQKLEDENIEVDKLALLNPQYVWQHTLTKSPFERWSRVRMKSIFPLLDLKHQLREMDRAFLLGGINFIVLVTRGTDTIPTTKTEVENTATQVRAQSRSPVIVSDHRINIEIITPDIEHVLNESKWDVIDQRILARLWGMFTMPDDTGNKETSMTMGRVIARGLASRRYMMKRSIEKHVIQAVIEHPLNVDAGFDRDTFIEFAPRRMELEFDPSVVSMIQSLRDRGDMSRETILTEFGFDQSLEASRREYEDDRWPKTFEPVNVPFDSPNKGNPDKSGREGGRPDGSTTKTKKTEEE
jgi:hypothetical protein